MFAVATAAGRERRVSEKHRRTENPAALSLMVTCRLIPWHLGGSDDGVLKLRDLGPNLLFSKSVCCLRPAPGMLHAQTAAGFSRQHERLHPLPKLFQSELLDFLCCVRSKCTFLASISRLL